jgi:hypothetical protein
MNVRTWRQAQTLMAACDVPLSESSLAAALSAARRRWEPLEDIPPALLVTRDELPAAEELAAHPLLELSEVREVSNLRDGWAAAWLLAPAPDAPA